MGHFSVSQRRDLGRKIRDYKEKSFPGRGGGNRLAAHLGVTPKLLSQWISGAKEPTMIQLHSLAKIFGASMQQLCSIPKIKKAKGHVTGLEMILDVTELYKAMRAKKTNRKQEMQIGKCVKSVVHNELKDIF